MKKQGKIEPQQVTDRETEILLELLEGCLGLEGDVVELGCYRGDTSLLLQRKLLAEKPEKKLWIYDSFEGLPEKTVEDASVAGEQFRAGELLVTKRAVVERFRKAGLKVPIVKKGFFEDLDAERDLPEKICFGFLDGDLYRSIKTSFYLCTRKMVSKGKLVVHDYNNPELPGVTKAVEEFLAEQPTAKLRVTESLAVLQVA